MSRLPLSWAYTSCCILCSITFTLFTGSSQQPCGDRAYDVPPPRWRSWGWRACVAGLQPQTWSVPELFPVTPRPPLLTSLQYFSLQEGAELQMWPFHVLSASLLREQLAEILIGLGDNFSESIFFKLYLQNSEKSLFFFSPWEVPVFQRIQTELSPGNWLLCSWVLKHTSRWGHFILLYASITEKFSLSGLCDFNSDDIWGRCQSINASGTIFSFWISLWYILLYEPVSLGSKLHSPIEGPHWTQNHLWCSSKILLMKNMWEWTA